MHKEVVVANILESIIKGSFDMQVGMPHCQKNYPLLTSVVCLPKVMVGVAYQWILLTILERCFWLGPDAHGVQLNAL